VIFTGIVFVLNSERENENDKIRSYTRRYGYESGF
jgi:hypothetical protein